MGNGNKPNIVSNGRLAIISIVTGIIITMVTGLLESPQRLLGATWYGYPLTWIRKLVLAPQYNPWKVDFMGLAIDIIFWSIVAFAVFFVIKRLKSRK